MIPFDLKFRLHHVLASALVVGVFVVIAGAKSASANTGDTCVGYVGIMPAGPSSTCQLTVSAADPEGDRIYYVFDWDDGTSTRVPGADGTLPPDTKCDIDEGLPTVPSGTSCFSNHTYTSEGPAPAYTYAVSVYAYDEANHQSKASDPVGVTIQPTNRPPNVPSLVAPAPSSASTYAVPRTDLIWKGGDFDCPNETVSYDVYLAPVGQLLGYQGTIMLPSCDVSGQIIDYTGAGSLTRGTTYNWRVKATDGQGNTSLGPIWAFTVNRLPVVSGVSFVRDPQPPSTPINTQALISWTVVDPDAGQTLSHTAYYSLQPIITSATTIVSSLTPAQAHCPSGDGCYYVWQDSGLACLTNGDYYGAVQVSDGLEFSAPVFTPTTSTVNHIETRYSPGPGDSDFTPVAPAPGLGNGANNSFSIGQGTIQSASSFIKFLGASGTSSNPSATANSSGNPAQYSGDLAAGDYSGDIPLYGLMASSVSNGSVTNNLAFTVGNGGRLRYRVRYDIYTAQCYKPYLSVDSGSIYSSRNLIAKYPPPGGSYNATYLVLAGGTGSTTLIQNFVSGTTSIDKSVNPSFGPLPYPGVNQTSVPQLGAFDYYGLTHKADGSGGIVSDGGTNLYGQVVHVYPTGTSWPLGTSPTLCGDVYYFKGDLAVPAAAQSSITFNNANGLNCPGTHTSTLSGAGLIIVDGDLTFAKDVQYQSGPLPASSTIKSLASVGWFVTGKVVDASGNPIVNKGNVVVNDSVGALAGTFYLAGLGTVPDPNTGHTGRFSSSSSPLGSSSQLIVNGALIGKSFTFSRTYTGGPAEKVVADGRIFINTPPGFGDMLRTLPAWTPRTP